MTAPIALVFAALFIAPFAAPAMASDLGGSATGDGLLWPQSHAGRLPSALEHVVTPALADVQRAIVNGVTDGETRRDAIVLPLARQALQFESSTELQDARANLLAQGALLRETLMATEGTSATPGADIRAPPLVALDLAGEDSVYTEDYALLVDVGGNDTYLNNAGGNGIRTLLWSDACAAPADSSGAAALFDFAGDDRYVGNRSCGSNGGAVYGAGLLVDFAGADRYEAGTIGVNGGAAGGAGFLLDVAGNDVYLAGDWGANGGARFGTGALHDSAGNDLYQAGSSGTNGGADFGGFGSLVDLAGDDVYKAGHVGTNGGGVDGTGHLYDGGGNDSYEGAIGAALADWGDIAGWGVNGGAAHAGHGRLVDAGGVDHYKAIAWCAVNGQYWATCGLAPAVVSGSGLLVDGGGTGDRYETDEGTTTDRTFLGIPGGQFDL